MSIDTENLPQISENEPLAKHTSWRVGGPARYYAEPRSAAQAMALAAWAQERELPLIWIGGGTNILARDSGFNGLVARYRAQAWQIEEQGEHALLHIEAGAPMAGTARRIGGLGWAGLAWAEGVPGTIGGAVFGNAGCYGGDMAGLVQQIQLLVGAEQATWPAERLEYGYRRSALKDGQLTFGAPPLILSAMLKLSRGDKEEIAAAMARIATERKGKTPIGSTCGSVFKNPSGQSAGRLIEQAGLKGHKIGQAEISQRHGNYILNTGGASSDDILALIETAQSEVSRQFGVELHLEVRVL